MKRKKEERIEGKKEEKEGQKEEKEGQNERMFFKERIARE
jgi:hypothetical protein